MGHEKHGYGAPPKVYPTYKTMMLDELRDKLDPNRVHFTNWAPKDVYRNILQVSSAHVHLTYPFLLSWSMLEAMSVGAPVIASDTAPVREMIRHEENGLLFDFFDTNGLVNQIVRVLEDKDLREKIIENGKNEVVKRFNLKDSLKTLEKLIIS
jgi:glycosyltransferase involved in cell wall biosynthesis